MVKDIIQSFKAGQFNSIIIYGATASGKSDLALKLGNELSNPLIINGDSMQVYKDIPIITAQPKDLSGHYLYSFISPDDNSFSVAKWLSLVAEKVNSGSITPIIVGGTGMYISSLINGLTQIPEIPIEITQNITQELNSHGLENLLNKLKSVDPLTASKISDQQRTIRALGVYEYTGKPISHWQKFNHKYIDSSKSMKVWVKPPREILYERINSRFIKMIERGVVDELKILMEKYNSYPKAIGLREVAEYINGNIDMIQLINTVQQLTRNYAKRQETWFRNQLLAHIVKWL